ncbi:hypothetical protein BDV98DRAFT_556830 [Pterulicium gracile]|uniref:Uncharacterized protein n=1 Tax=Pterulicium gracile TaxID=1884261 RepID=A0A5C3QXX4_9AGAR|nr:hypothetical protein BDV98DRAFT_556830 [Pterula gracilis]
MRAKGNERVIREGEALNEEERTSWTNRNMVLGIENKLTLRGHSTVTVLTLQQTPPHQSQLFYCARQFALPVTTSLR